MTLQAAGIIYAENEQLKDVYEGFCKFFNDNPGINQEQADELLGKFKSSVSIIGGQVEVVEKALMTANTRETTVITLQQQA